MLPCVWPAAPEPVVNLAIQCDSPPWHHCCKDASTGGVKLLMEAWHSALCRGARSFTDAPVVFVRRDNPNIFHLFERELLPLFISLQQYHMQHLKFQVGHSHAPTCH